MIFIKIFLLSELAIAIGKKTTGIIVPAALFGYSSFLFCFVLILSAQFIYLNVPKCYFNL